MLKTPLPLCLEIESISAGYDDLSLTLARRGFNLNQVDKNERGVLWHAVDAGLVKLVSTIVHKPGIRLDHPDVNGYSPLARAVLLGRLNLARMLVTQKANVQARTRENNSMLMLAVLSGDSALTQYILEQGVDIDAQNNVGDTALIMAAAQGDQELVRLLIDKGADTQIRNSDDLNAYLIAGNAGHDQVAILQGEKVIELLENGCRLIQHILNTALLPKFSVDS